ncbi:MAG: MaoC family dehydratase [Myxococcota bacterium]
MSDRSPPPAIYYEDYAPGVVETMGSYTVSKEEIVEFASRYDPQPFHLDEAAANASIFGGLTASSTHTFALMGLINAKRGVQPAVVANLGADSLKFPEPVRPGDTLTLTGECLTKRVSKSRPGLGIVTSRTCLWNQRGELVMETDTKYMVKLRGAR